MKSYYRELLVVASLVVFLTGCAFVPKVSKNQNYTAGCEMLTRKLTLDIEELDIGDCDINEDLGGCLVFEGIISPILTFVASGSVVIIGNTVHWIEYQGRCEKSELRKQIAKLKSV